MASTVNSAFSEFLSDTVRLNESIASSARTSRDNLIKNINGFSGNEDFFNVYSDRNLNFGSFARHTKIRPLDDIDIMVCLSARNGDENRTYIESSGCIYISGIGFDRANGLLTPNSNYLNSTKVINRLISKLSDLGDYRKAEMHKNHESATLQLKSYTWNYDIVPCFYTDTGYYLIPDGNGNWKKTDPRVDNNRTTEINQKHKGKLLDVIRLMKYWNSRKHTIRIGSYLLECMILSLYDQKAEKENYWVDLELRDLLKALSTSILYSVPDPKGFQGELNTFSWDERKKISDALLLSHYNAVEAASLEITDKNHKAAINKWKEVLGPNFPDYTD